MAAVHHLFRDGPSADLQVYTDCSVLSRSQNPKPSDVPGLEEAMVERGCHVDSTMERAMSIAQHELSLPISQKCRLRQIDESTLVVS